MKNFPLTTALFEGALVPAAILFGWLLGRPPLATFSFNLNDALLGVAATVPLLVVFWLCLVIPFRPFQNITQILDEMLVPSFRDCAVIQLLIIAALAGVGEEMLFRGVIQASAAVEIGGPHGVWLGLLIAAVLFGLLHPITPTYAILAGLIGLYLGGIWLVCGNLLTPVVTHGLYDFVALMYLVKRKSNVGETTG